MSAARSLLGRLVEGDLDDEILDVALDAVGASTRPVTLPGVCNLLWFERGSAGGYDGAAFYKVLEGVRLFAHGLPARGEPVPPQPAVPLGALTTVRIGNDEYYGEVVWREGAHPGLDAGWIPGWLAGAPSGLPLEGTPDPHFVPPPGPRVLRERLVVDFRVLGAELAPTEVKLGRIRDRGLRLDPFGHLVADVVYPEGLDEGDEVAFWAAWCASQHPAALAAAGVAADPVALGEAASVLAEGLAASGVVRSFGPYYLSAERYRTLVVADRDHGDLARVVRGLARVPSVERLGWASMSHRLVETLEPGAMVGCGWPTAVVTASLLALDTLGAEAPEGDWGGVHLRLDDAWQGGGLWRAESLEATTPVDADPAVALGLGWVEHTGGEIARAPALEAVPAPSWFGDADADDLEWDITGSEATWLVHLSAGDIDTDRFRLPRSVSAAVAATLTSVDQDQLVVVLDHAGEGDSRAFSAMGEDGYLSFPWPLGVLPGITVRCSWQVRSTVVRAATRLLAEPVEVAGITYHHVHNTTLALAAVGMGEGGGRTVTLRDLVRAAVRRHGAPTEDGCVALTLEEVLRRCFGPDGELVPGYGTEVLRRAVRAAATGLIATGAVRLDGELVVIEPRRTAAGRRADAELLARFVDATTQQLRRSAQRHWVPPTIVNLPEHWRHSEMKEQSWAEVAGTDGLPSRPLAPNQTWRKGHARGSGKSPAVTADLERAKASLTELGVDEEAERLDAVVTDPYAEHPAHRRSERPAPGGSRP